MLKKFLFGDELARFSVKGSSRRRHIERWRADDRAEDIWNKLKAAIPDLDPSEFIRLVLKARQDALSLTARLAATRSERDYWLPRDAKELLRLHQLLLSGRMSPAQIAWRLENLAACLRLIDNPFSIPDDVEFSREDVKGSRARKLFVQILGRHFRGRCGQWRDAELAVLTQIAGLAEGDFDSKAVAQLRAPSTRAGRAKKPETRGRKAKPC
jgi:hypothetical protein